MVTNPSCTLADQLSGIVELFRKAMWAEPRTRGLGPLSVAIWQRVRGFERRFSALYSLWKAGKLPQVRARAVAHPSPQPPPSRGGGVVSLSAVDVARLRPG